MFYLLNRHIHAFWPKHIKLIFIKSNPNIFNRRYLPGGQHGLALGSTNRPEEVCGTALSPWGSTFRRKQ